ncbi:four helix bundle protein [Nonlabens spongiae]|uniref:Four helix bundle protein n=2 Tax=Nonlabens spongiae TaxID=331648 RepID=A0A1W6MM40_9FLAO|nr:four helix bundle protein [Nonlabens spongiae]
MAGISSFKDLECWKKGRFLRIRVSEVIKTFPLIEKYELISQMRRASRSVTHNIAEGYGRFHYQENIQFCRTARGSLTELQDQIDCARCEGYIDEKIENELNDMALDTLKILNGYINYLKKIKG